MLAFVGARFQAVAPPKGQPLGLPFIVLLGLVLILIKEPDTQGLGFPGTNNSPILLFYVLNVILLSRKYIHML